MDLCKIAFSFIIIFVFQNNDKTFYKHILDEFPGQVEISNCKKKDYAFFLIKQNKNEMQMTLELNCKGVSKTQPMI